MTPWSCIGRKSFIDAYMEEKIVQWVKEVERLTIIAKICLQAAYAALMHGLSRMLTYLMLSQVSCLVGILFPRCLAIGLLTLIQCQLRRILFCRLS